MTLKGSRSAQKGSNPSNTFDSIFPGVSQKVSFTATSAASSAFSSDVTVVRVYSDQDCYIEFGTVPTATTSSLFLPGGITEYFGVAASYKVAAIRVTTSGTLYVTEGAA